MAVNRKIILDFALLEVIWLYFILPHTPVLMDPASNPSLSDFDTLRVARKYEKAISHPCCNFGEYPENFAAYCNRFPAWWSFRYLQ